MGPFPAVSTQVLENNPRGAASAPEIQGHRAVAVQSGRELRNPSGSWVLGSLAEQEASAQHAGDAADGQRDAGAAHQAGSRLRRGAGGGVGRQGVCVERVYAGCRDAVEQARVGGATEHQQAARFKQQRGGRPGWGPGLRGGLKVSGSPEVGGGGRREISRFGGSGGSGARVSESQGQRLRRKCAPKDRGFGMKIPRATGPGPGGEGRRGGKGEWSAVFWEGVGTRLQMGASMYLRNLQGAGTAGSVVPVS